jgi:hypothetical protein
MRVRLQPAIDHTAIKAVDLQPVIHSRQIVHIKLIWFVLQDGQQLVGEPAGRVVLFQREKRPGTATIFRRRSSSTASTRRIAARVLQWQNAFEPELMLPEIAEVVLVAEAAVDAQAQVTEAHLPWIVGKADAARLGDAVVLAVDHKAVQVGVGPVEGNLEDVVEVGDGGIAANEQPAPDRRADLKQRGVELLDRYSGRKVGHRTLLSYSNDDKGRVVRCRKNGIQP